MCVHWSGVIRRENTFSGNSFYFYLYNVYTVTVVVCVLCVFHDVTTNNPPPTATTARHSTIICVFYSYYNIMNTYITICISIIKPSISIIPRVISIMYFMLTDIAYKYWLWFRWKIVLFFFRRLLTIVGKKIHKH